MALVAALDDAFDIMMDTEDVIDMNCFRKPKKFYRNMESNLSKLLENKVAFVTGASRGIGKETGYL